MVMTMNMTSQSSFMVVNYTVSTIAVCTWAFASFCYVWIALMTLGELLIDFTSAHVA